MRYALTLLGLVGIFIWASWGTGFNVPKLIGGFPHVYRLACRMLPAVTEILLTLVRPKIEIKLVKIQ